MIDDREMVIGLLATLVSITIVTGSLVISIAEIQTGLRLSRHPASPPTVTHSPTLSMLTPRPGEPTLTPSPTPNLTITDTTHPSSTPSCQIPKDWVAITIQHGDTLENLGQTYQTTPDALMRGNCLLISSLSPGSRFYVPEPVSSLTPISTATYRPTATRCLSPPVGWVKYTIVSGDTLYSLAVLFGVTVPELQAANCMGTSTQIYTGETLWVPNLPTTTPSITVISSPTPNPTNTQIPSSTPKPTRTWRPTRTRRPTRTPRTKSIEMQTPTPTPSQSATIDPTYISTPTSEPYP